MKTLFMTFILLGSSLCASNNDVTNYCDICQLIEEKEYEMAWHELDTARSDTKYDDLFRWRLRLHIATLMEHEILIEECLYVIKSLEIDLQAK